ncbi:MAG: DUF4118 domain-containing protein [Bryobacteraceae bacterium]
MAIGLLGVAAVTWTFLYWIPANASTVGFFLLIAVLSVATAGGFRAAAAVSAAATLCFNYYFLPPVGTFTIADPANWVALFTFLLTALVASHLSDRAQTEAAEAKRSQWEAEQLYSLSKSILLTEGSDPIGTQAAQSIAGLFGAQAVSILEGSSNTMFHGGARDIPGVESRLHEAMAHGRHERDERLGVDVWPIALGSHAVGALAVAGLGISETAVQSMLNLVAIALERVRTLEAANRAEVARRSEEFKSTLLDAVAHEFKTPLTSIKAAATGLRGENTAAPGYQQELAAIIEEETDRLNRLVSAAVRMARLDAGKVELQRARTPLSSLVEGAVASFDGRGGERIHRSGVTSDELWADPELIVLALRQVLDNALKYSGPGTMVDCRMSRENADAVIRISDQGPGIPERERERVFDKFYRVRTGSAVAGTGLGLHIAREIVRKHGGDMWIEPQDGHGACFGIRLPVGEETR